MVLATGIETPRWLVVNPDGGSESAAVHRDDDPGLRPRKSPGDVDDPTTYTVSLLNAGGTPFTGLETLSIAKLPARVTPSFAPSATMSGGQLRTLTLTAAPAAAVGPTTLTITVSATIDGSSVTRTTNADLTVLAGGRTAALGQITFRERHADRRRTPHARQRDDDE